MSVVDLALGKEHGLCSTGNRNKEKRQKVLCHCLFFYSFLFSPVPDLKKINYLYSSTVATQYWFQMLNI